MTLPEPFNNIVGSSLCISQEYAVAVLILMIILLASPLLKITFKAIAALSLEKKPDCAWQAQMAEREQAKVALKESEAELRAIFEAMTEIILIFDIEGRHLKIAPTNSDLLYKPADERVGKTLHEVFPKEEADLFLGYVRHAIEFQETIDVEYKLIIRGEEVWSAGRVSPMSKDTALFVARDITAQKLAEQKYRSIFENAEEGIFQSTSDGRYIDVNPALYRMYGYKSAKDLLANLTCVQQLYVVPQRHAEIAALLEKSDSISNFESQVRCKSGNIIWVSENIRAIRSAKGNLLYYEGSVRNITAQKEAEAALRSLNAELEQRVQTRTFELKLLVEQLQAEIIERQRAERALQESEQRFRATFNQAAVGISQNQLDGQWISVNQKHCEVLGYAQEELMAMSFQELTHPDDLASDLALFDRLLCGEISMYTLEKRYRRKDGAYIWINLTVSLVRDLVGNPLYSIAIAEDINQRKKAEKDIQLALQQERELSELKSQFITTVSHEFRTPLTMIFSSAELLERHNFEPENPKRAKYFNHIYSGVDRITHVLDNTLALMKLEEDVLLNCTPLNLTNFCQDFIENWSISIDNQHHISFINHDKVDRVACLNVFLLHQILTQLLSNAVRYSPKGGDIFLEIDSRDTLILLKVSDSGIGIPVEEQTKIFDKFYRASNADLIPGTPGVGLGLAIAERAVLLQQGKIEVSSEVNNGTTFVVSFPTQIVCADGTSKPVNI